MPIAIERDSLSGFGGLRMRRKQKLSPANVPPSSLMDLKTTSLPRRKAANRRRRVHFNEQTVANGLFKAEHDPLYQGKQEGPLGDTLPQSWDPIAKAAYRPDIASNSFQDSSTVQEMNTLDTAMPKLDQQWGKINTIERPLAFPIEISNQFTLR
jgi:hypothetical protein